MARLAGLAVAVAIASAVLLATPWGSARAQVPGVPSGGGETAEAGAAAGGGLDSIVEAARASGSTVVVISPEGAQAERQAPAASEGMLGTFTRAGDAVSTMIEVLPSAPEKIVRALRGAGGNDSLAWLLSAALLAVLAVAVGFLARIAVSRWGRSYFRYIYNPTPRSRAEKIGYLLMRTVLMWITVAAFLAAGALTIVVITSFGPIRVTAMAVLASTALFLWAHDLFKNVFVPDVPEYRLIPLDDASSTRMFRQLMTLFAIATVAFGVCLWMGWFALAPVVHDLMLALSSLLISVMMIGYVLVHRKTVAAMIRGSGPQPSRRRQVIASVWHVVAILYFLGATTLNVANILIGAEPIAGPVLGPVLAFVAAIGFFGILIVLIDRRFRSQQAALHGALRNEADEAASAVAAPEAPEALAAAQAADGTATSDATTTAVAVESAAEEAGTAATAPAPVATDEINPVTVWQLRWKALTEHLAAVASFIVGLVVLLAVWGQLDAGDEGSKLAGMGVVLLGAYVLYQLVKTWIDGKIEEEEPAMGAGESEDGMGPGSSRLATLLPLLRNVLLITIGVIAGMVVLAGMGVDIGPLFAGAGVIGLAVGFGAQALIRDIFSGAFFLVDDAFRRGEYIDVGGVMGSVEKISLRSFQLRHHNGPLHTVPFGEIKQLTNYSRDWVIMKLPLRLTYDTDVEKVRKLVKKLGQQMLDDPEIGHLFLQPLKSQGVIQMEDSAMILRVKFMTRPGDQFVARRHVYTRVHDLFDEEGIRFAHRQVTVRIADDDAPPGTTPEERERRKQAALGAVQPIIDAEADAEEDLAISGPGS